MKSKPSPDMTWIRSEFARRLRLIGLFAVIFFVLSLPFAPIAASAADQVATKPAVIPLPQKMELADGTLQLSPDTPIYVDSASRKTGEYLAERLRRATGYALPV